MAIIAEVVLRGLSPEMYDRIRAEVGYLEHTPDGGLVHLMWWEGEDAHGCDAWESEDTFNAFAADRLGPAMGKLGINIAPEVTFHPAHEVFSPEVLRLTTS